MPTVTEAGAGASKLQFFNEDGRGMWQWSGTHWILGFMVFTFPHCATGKTRLWVSRWVFGKNRVVTFPFPFRLNWGWEWPDTDDAIDTFLLVRWAWVFPVATFACLITL